MLHEFLFAGKQFTQVINDVLKTFFVSPFDNIPNPKNKWSTLSFAEQTTTQRLCPNGNKQPVERDHSRLLNLPAFTHD